MAKSYDEELWIVLKIMLVCIPCNNLLSFEFKTAHSPNPDSLSHAVCHVAVGQAVSSFCFDISWETFTRKFLDDSIEDDLKTLYSTIY